MHHWELDGRYKNRGGVRRKTFSLPVTAHTESSTEYKIPQLGFGKTPRKPIFAGLRRPFPGGGTGPGVRGVRAYPP